MKAKYLLRFDDICPTTNWDVWDQVERILLEHGIRPLLAVVPDNRDEFLRAGEHDPRFWERVREWQSRGWTIGMHGFQHVCLTDEGGILNLNACSEFGGMPIDQQEERLRAGLRIFAAEGVTPSVFVAPSHSFDLGTVRLLSKVGIPAISDGFALHPFTDADDVTWIPQQFWRFRWMPLGVWTVCIHPNGWAQRDIASFRRDVRRYRDRLVDVPAIQETFGGRRFTRWDLLFYSSLPILVRAKRSMTRSRTKGTASVPPGSVSVVAAATDAAPSLKERSNVPGGS